MNARLDATRRAVVALEGHDGLLMVRRTVRRATVAARPLAVPPLAPTPLATGPNADLDGQSDVRMVGAASLGARPAGRMAEARAAPTGIVRTVDGVTVRAVASGRRMDASVAELAACVARAPRPGVDPADHGATMHVLRRAGSNDR